MSTDSRIRSSVVSSSLYKFARPAEIDGPEGGVVSLLSPGGREAPFCVCLEQQAFHA